MAQSGQLAGRTLKFRHESAKQLYDYWNALRNGRLAPARSDIDPAFLRQSLASTFILELRDDHHFLFKIAGTSLCAAFGRELRDHNFLSLLDDDARGELLSFFTLMRAKARGGLVRFSANTLDRSVHPGEFTILPLTGRGNAITHAIGYFQLYRGIETLALRKLIRLQLSGLDVIDPATDRIDVEAHPPQPLPQRPLALVKDKSAEPKARALPGLNSAWAQKLASFIDNNEE